MTTCCHCGRTLTYDISVRNGCGSWCYYNKGLCNFSDRYQGAMPDNQPESLKGKVGKGLVKGAIVGAALGVTCVIAHVACIITAFIHHHYYLQSAASSVYSALKNKAEHEKHPVREASLSGAMDTSNAAVINEMSSEIGGKFAEAVHEKFGTSLAWAGEIGKETGKSMLEQGSSAAFDWCSKAVV